MRVKVRNSRMEGRGILSLQYRKLDVQLMGCSLEEVYDAHELEAAYKELV